MLNLRSQLSAAKVAQLKTFEILLIVRPGKLIDLLKLELIHKGYKVEINHDSISGLLKYRETDPQLVILDSSISSLSVFDLCCRLRSSNPQLPILVLTPGRQVRERVAALDAGADDCISVPFAMPEFLARIRVQLRKYQNSKPSVLFFDDLSLSTFTREVCRGDRYIYLTFKEFELLEYLLTHPRQVLTRTQIIDRVWGYDFRGNSNVIEVYVRYLRLKLEQNNDRRLIHTVRGVGYVLRESN